MPKSNRSQPASSPEVIRLADINLEEAFQLIGKILPLQSCLYHQVLPISVQDQCLTLAMVKAQDAWLLDYIKYLLPSGDYTLKCKSIDPETHQFIIDSYQKYNRSPQQEQEPPINDTLTSQSETNLVETKNQNQKTTLILDDYEAEESANLLNSLQGTSQKPQTFPSLESLANLPAKKLWDELLARVVKGGIGRLYFERNSEHGNVIWSQDGVLQSSLKQLDLVVFQNLIRELKSLARLPDFSIEKPKTIELERNYKQERLLFRCRFSRNAYGEEATVQVLRGKALKFYQQKQMDSLGEQALRLSQQLERKLNQIQACTQINPSSLDFLPSLKRIQRKVEKQLELLES